MEEKGAVWVSDYGIHRNEMKRILVTPRAFHSYGAEAIKKMQEHGYETIVNDTGLQFTHEEFSKYAAEADGIIVGVDIIDKELLDKCNRLKAIVKFGVGTDNIDVEYANKLGIAVGRTAGSNSTSVAEFTIGLIFACARNIVYSAVDVKKGNWNKLTGIELKGKTIGIIGFGNIGREVARIASGIGMNVICYDVADVDEKVLKQYNATFETFDTLLGKSDIITVHVPLLEQTRNLISHKEIGLMKKSAFLINVARGGIVDEEAILKALRNKEIAFYAADVFSSEPPEQNEWTLELFSLDNFILTPHIAARTLEAEINTINMSTNTLLELLEKANG